MIKIQTTDRATGKNFFTWVHGRVEDDGTLVLNNDPGDNITGAWNEAGQKLTIPQPDKLPTIKFSKE